MNAVSPYRNLETSAWFARALTVLFAVYVLTPIVWLLINSTKSTSDLFSTFGFWFSDSPQLIENIRLVVTHDDGIFLRWMANTVLYSASAAVGATVVSFLAGYAFAKWEFKGRDLMFWAILAAIMVPGAALAVPTFQLMSRIGLINSAWAVILPGMVSPFGLYLMRVYIAGAVPDEIIDAARVDGASEFTIVSRIVSRIVTPGLATVFLFTFVATWNNYLLPLLVITDPDKQPVTLGLSRWNEQSLFPTTGSEVLYNLVVTGSLLSVVPLIVLFVFLQRYVRSGLTLGAVK